MIPRHLIIGITAMLAVALAMSLYMWHMSSRVQQNAAPAAYTHPVAAPVQGPTEQVTLYVAYDDPGVLRAQPSSIPLPAGRQERAQELLRALLGLYMDQTSSHPLGPGAEIRDVYLVDPGLAVIDTNDAFADGHDGAVASYFEAASIIRASLQKYGALRGTSAKKARELGAWFRLMNWQSDRELEHRCRICEVSLPAAPVLDCRVSLSSGAWPFAAPSHLPIPGK